MISVIMLYVILNIIDYKEVKIYYKDNFLVFKIKFFLCMCLFFIFLNFIDVKDCSFIMFYIFRLILVFS